jgi:hypothetical protein
MTTNYNVSFYSFFRYFFSSIREEGDDLNVSLEDYKIIMDWLHLLYKFVLSELFKLFFIRDKIKFIEDLNPKEVNVGEFKLDLSYLKSVDGPRDSTKLKIRNHTTYTRITFVTKILTEDLDDKQTYLALEPNLIQAYDAYLCHRTIIKTELSFSIHDCFAISSVELGNLMDFQNNYFRNELHNEIEKSESEYLKDWYSIFILL